MTYPVTAKELLDSEYRGEADFFLLCQLDNDGETPKIIIDDGFPIAVNKDDLRNEIDTKQGIKLPRRYEITNGPIPDDLTNTEVNWAQMRTAATGLALWVSSEKLEEPMIYLIQNSADKPVNPSRWNFPSNLMRDNILEQAFQAANSETALFIPTKDGKKIIGVNFELPQNFPDINSEFKDKILSRRSNQEDNIRKQLSEKHPEFADTPIEWRVIQTTEREDPTIQEVKLNLLGKEFTTKAHLLDDPKANSVNIHIPVSVDLDQLANEYKLDLTKMMAIDPEKFGRNQGLHTQTSAQELDTIPAPTDYFEQLSQ